MSRNNNEFKKQNKKTLALALYLTQLLIFFSLFICQETQKQAFEVLLAIQVAELVHCPQHKPDMYGVIKK